jgi:hypothetical protein
MPDSMLKRIRDSETPRRLNPIGKDGRIITESVLENEVPGLVPIVTRLCTASSGLISALYICDPSVHYVHKGSNPGQFCGYRNIQMLVSYICGTKSKGHEHFKAGLPGIFQIQDLVEAAWDREPYSVGRQATGGIRNTRKWIGTPEVRQCHVFEPSCLYCISGGRLLQISGYRSLCSYIQSHKQEESTRAAARLRRRILFKRHHHHYVQSAQVSSSSNLPSAARTLYDNHWV